MNNHLSSLLRWLPPAGVLLFGFTGCIPCAQAATLFWDADGATPGFTALPTGTWGSSAFWSTDSTGSTAGANTTTTSVDDVNFGSATSGFSTASTVTISGTQSVRNITFGAGNAASLVLSGGTDLTLGSSGTISNNSSSLLSIGAKLLGTNGFTKSGTGTLVLTNAANTISGTVNLTEGALQLNQSALSQTSAVNINAGTLTISASTANAIGGVISFGGGKLLLNSASSPTDYSTQFSTAANQSYNISVGSTFLKTFTGVLSSAGGTLDKSDTGTLTLAAANTFSGATKVTGGNLILTNQLALQNSAIDTTSSVTGSSTQGLVLSGVTTPTFGGLTGTKALSTLFNTTSGGYGSVTSLTLNPGTGDNLSYSGIIGDGAAGMSLTKTGAGSQTLSGVNTYSGGTNINAGTLAIGNAAALGSSGTISFGGGTLQYSGITTDLSSRFSTANNQSYSVDTNGQSVTLAGALTSLGGALAKTGTGTLSLSNASNTLDGGITINAGTLNFTTGGLGTTGAVTFTGNSTLQFGTATTTDVSSRLAISNGVTGTVDTNGNNVTFASGFGASGSGALTKAGSGTLRLNAANTYTGLTTVTVGRIIIGSGGSLASGNALTLTASSAAIFGNIGQTLGAVTNDNTTSNALNFSASTGTVTLASLSGSGSTGFGSNGIVTGGIGSGTVSSVGNFTANISGGTTTVGGLLTGNIFSGTVGAGSLSATTVTGGTNTITGTAGITTLSNGTTTVGGLATIGTLSGGTANLNGATSAITTLNGGTVNLGSSTGLTVSSGTTSGAITGTGGSLTKTSAGTLTLNGSNTYTGGTNIGAGTLNFTTGGLGSTGAVTFTGNSTLQYGTSTTTDLSSRLAIGNGITGTVDTNGNNVTFATAFGVSGSGALTKAGTGTLSLNAANTYTGLTTVNAGTLAIGSGGSLASGNALTLGASGLATFANAGQTIGSVSNANTTSDALNFTASTGTVTLASLSGAGNTTFGSNGTVTGGIGSGTVTSVGNLTASISGGTTAVGGLLTGNISAGTVGAGSLSATTVSGGTNTITGSAGITTLSNGTTTVGGVATIGTLSGGTANLNGATSAITTLNGGTVNLGASTTLSVSNGTTSGAITGSGGSLTKTSSGTLTLTGNNTYTGATTLSGGTLAFNAAAALGTTSGINLADTTTLTYTGAGATSFDRDISVTSGTGFLRNTGAGTLTLSGSLSKNGTVLTFAQGAFEVTGAISGGSANSDLVVDAATVTLNNANTFNGPTFLRNGATLNAHVLGALPTGTRTDLVLDDTGNGSSTLTLGANQVVASLTGASSSTVDLSSRTLTVGTTAGTTNFAGTLSNSSGTGSLIKDGVSTLTLTNANTYDGTTTVSAGVLAIQNAAALGSTTGGTTVGSGAALQLQNSLLIGAEALSLNGTGVGNTGALRSLSGTTDFGGLITLAGSARINTDAGTLTLSHLGTIIGAGFGLTVGGAGDTTIAGVIGTTTGTLTKDGVGTLALLETNTFSGTTTISAGTLQLGDRTTLNGSVAGDIDNNAALVFANPSSQTYAGAISGSGSLTKTGSGALTFNGTHTFTGTMAINQGSVVLSSSGSLGGTAVIVGSGLTPTASAGNAELNIRGDRTLGTSSAGSLTIKGGNTGGTPLGQGTLSLLDGGINTLTLANTTGGATNLTLGGTSDNAASLKFDANNTATDQIFVGQKLLLNAGGAIVSINQFGGTSLADATYDLMTFSSGSVFTGTFKFAGGASTLAIGGGRTFSLQNTGTAEQLLVATVVDPNAAYWSGAQNGSWNTLTGGNATNWINGPAGTDTNQRPTSTTNVFMTADSATNLSTTLGANFTINSLNFTGVGTSATGSVTVAGNTLTLNATAANGNVSGSGLTVESGSGAHSISSNVVLGNDQTWGNFSANTLIVSGVISGSHTLALTGDFTFSGAAANTFSGTTTLNSGTLHLAKNDGNDAIAGNLLIGGGTVQWDLNNQISNTCAVTVNGGTLALGNFSDTVGGVTLTDGSITGTGGVLTGSTYAVENGSISAILGGGGALTKTTSGTVILSGANTYTGGTTVSGGTLALGTTNALASGGAVTVSGATLALGAHDQTVGAVTLTSGSITGTGGVLTGSAYAVETGTISAILGGSGALTKATGGTVTLSGVNTYTGGTTVSAGTLALGLDNALASSGAVTVSGGTLALGAFDATVGAVSLTSGSITGSTGVLTGSSYAVESGTISAILGGSGAFTKTTSGTVILSGANTYTGGTTVSGGTLALGTTNALASGGAVTVSGGTLALGAHDQTVGAVKLISGSITGSTGVLTGSSYAVESGTISAILGGSAGLTKTTAGTATLSAANTYTGLTTVNAGALSIGSGGSLFSGNDLTLGASGTAVFANVGQTLGAVSNSNTTTNALNFSAVTGTATLASLSGAGHTRFGSDGIVTGGISAGTVTVIGNLTANISGGTTTVGGVATIGTLSDGTANLNGTTSAITTLSGGTVNLGSSTELTVSDGTTSGLIAGVGGSLTKTSSGTLTFNGANTYTGLTTVNAGALVFGSSGSLVSGNALTLGASGAANFANVGQTLGAVSNANTVIHALNFSAVTGTVTLASLSGAGDTTFGSNGIVAGGIGSGTVTTTGNLTASISGGTTTVGGLLTGNISAGTVGAGSLIATTVSGGTNTITGAAGITTLSSGITTVGGVATIGTLSGGTANLNGATSSITTLSGGSVNLGASTTLSVSGGTYAGVIAGTGGSLTKTDSGTFTLTGVNTYTGATTISAGTLSLHASSGAALANTSGVNIGSGATLALGAANQINSAANLSLAGGTLALQGFSQTLGTLALGANSAIDFTGASALVFTDSSGLNWNSALLSISNFSITTNYLRFGITGSGLDATQLSLIRFVEFGNSAARIDADGFLAPLNLNYSNTGTTDIVIANPITGTTTVDQSGSGKATLTGSNTSSGAATVTAGTLVIGNATGGNWAGSVTVSGTGTLKGRGAIAGAVLVNSGGTYSPGNSPAIQHVGSLTVNSGGFVAIELDGAIAGNGAGFHDQVISAGAVTLNGGTLSGSTVFTGSTSYVPTIGAFQAVITGSAVTGKFAAYDFSANPAGVSMLPEYTATAVNLYAVPSNYVTAVAGLNANQTQVGTALQSLRQTGVFEIDQRTTLDARSTLFNGLKTKDAAGLRTAYDQLTPEKLTALATATFQSSSILNFSLQQRSAELRRFGPASVSLNGVATPAEAEDYRMETVIEDGVHYQIAKAKPKKHYGYFAAATGAFASVDGYSDRFGSFSQTGAATAGVDYAFNDHHTVGLVVSQALADTDFSSNSGTARTTTSRLGVFHDYHNGGFFVNSSVSAGFSEYDTKRNITFLNQTTKGETQGLSYGGQLATGYDFKVGDYIMGPTASVAYDHAHINGFEETGSAADLRVGRQNADSLVTKLGVHVSRPFVANKIGWIPDMSLSASRQSFNPNSITARLAAGGDAFRVSPQAAGSEYINPGASLSAVLANGWTVRLSYDAILNPQSAEHRVNLSLNAGF